MHLSCELIWFLVSSNGAINCIGQVCWQPMHLCPNQFCRFAPTRKRHKLINSVIVSIHTDMLNPFQYATFSLSKSVPFPAIWKPSVWHRFCSCSHFYCFNLIIHKCHIKYSNRLEQYICQPPVENKLRNFLINCYLSYSVEAIQIHATYLWNLISQSCCKYNPI